MALRGLGDDDLSNPARDLKCSSLGGVLVGEWSMWERERGTPGGENSSEYAPKTKQEQISRIAEESR